MKTALYAIAGAALGVVLVWLGFALSFAEVDFDWIWLSMEIGLVVGAILGGLLGWKRSRAGGSPAG